MLWTSRWTPLAGLLAAASLARGRPRVSTGRAEAAAGSAAPSVTKQWSMLGVAASQVKPAAVATPGNGSGPPVGIAVSSTGRCLSVHSWMAVPSMVGPPVRLK